MSKKFKGVDVSNLTRAGQRQIRDSEAEETLYPDEKFQGQPGHRNPKIDEAARTRVRREQAARNSKQEETQREALHKRASKAKK